MSLDLIDVALWALLLAVAAWFAFPQRSVLQRWGSRFAAEHRAYVDAMFVAQLDRAVVRERRTGAALVILAPATLLVLSRTSHILTLSSALLSLAFAGIAWGQLAAAGHEFPATPGAPTIARTRRVGVEDYVPRAAGWSIAFDAAVCLAVAALALRRSTSGAADAAEARGLLLSAVVIALCSLATPLYLRALCARSQRATDAAHLYFQDAWRSQHLRMAVLMPAYATMMLLTGVVWLDVPEVVTYAAILAVLAPALIVVIGSKLRFRRRLWSTLEPQRVVYPGDVVGGIA